MADKKRAMREGAAGHIEPFATSRSRFHRGAVAIGLFLCATRCGSSSNGSGFEVPGGASGSSTGGGGAEFADGGALNTGAGDGASVSTLPAEMKLESNYESPVATGNLVWIANPSSGLVAYIDAATFVVQTVESRERRGFS
jgi:hypothetical protein